MIDEIMVKLLKISEENRKLTNRINLEAGIIIGFTTGILVTLIIIVFGG